MAPGWDTPHRVWPCITSELEKSNFFAFVSIFLFFIHYIPFLQTIPLQFQSLVAKSVWATADYGIFAHVCTKLFLVLRLCKWRANRHVSINMRHRHYGKSSWVRLFGENIKKTIPIMGTFGFSLLSEFSLQRVPPAFTLLSFSGQKRNTRHWDHNSCEARELQVQTEISWISKEKRRKDIPHKRIYPGDLKFTLSLIFKCLIFLKLRICLNE